MSMSVNEENCPQTITMDNSVEAIAHYGEMTQTYKQFSGLLVEKASVSNSFSNKAK